MGFLKKYLDAIRDRNGDNTKPNLWEMDFYEINKFKAMDDRDAVCLMENRLRELKEWESAIVCSIESLERDIYNEHQRVGFEIKEYHLWKKKIEGKDE